MNQMISYTCMAVIVAGTVAIASAEELMLVYTGTYTGERSQGIYVLRMDPATGKLSKPVLAAKANRASFVAIHPNGKFLYAVNEVMDAKGMKTGAVCSYSIGSDGTLLEMNYQSSGGKGPCFVGLDREGLNVLVANYASGAIAVIPIGEDGKLKEPTAVVQHEGKGPNQKRQEGPHAHSIFADPTNHFVLAVDLGIDRVMIYRFNARAGTLKEHGEGVLAPGKGPRHLAFGKSGKFVYVINELGNTVTVFTWDSEVGSMREIQDISTLPADFHETSYCAEVLVHPSGKWMYGSNRGHDSIGVFEIDEQTGKLTARGQVSTGGKWPRNFGIDPSGQWLLAANQNSDSIVEFRIDQKTGMIEPTGERVEVGQPTCARFFAVK